MPAEAEVAREPGPEPWLCTPFLTHMFMLCRPRSHELSCWSLCPEGASRNVSWTEGQWAHDSFLAPSEQPWNRLMSVLLSGVIILLGGTIGQKMAGLETGETFLHSCFIVSDQLSL